MIPHKNSQSNDADDLVFSRSDSMSRVYSFVDKISNTDRTILVTGPTGAGKEVIVRLIHQRSANSGGPFVDVNCGAIPEALIESLLFGHEKGAFTGANCRQEGVFASASGGTLFLDEIAELSLSMQAKLLRVLETRAFYPVGSVTRHAFTGRVIAATHFDLSKRVADHLFREDLYHRLNVFHIAVPGLQKRREDIPELVDFFAKRTSRPLIFDVGALRYLARHPWPGNIRQLRNTIERIATLCEQPHVTEAVVRTHLERNHEDTPADSLTSLADKILDLDVSNKLVAIQQSLVNRALERAKGNKSAAARLLGVHRKVVERRVGDTTASMEQITLLYTSGKQAMSANLYHRAARRFEEALSLLDHLEQTDEVDTIRLDVLLKRSICLRSVVGWTDRKAISCYERAISLGERLGKTELLGPAIFGIWAKKLMNLDLAEAKSFAKKYLDHGVRIGSENVMLQAQISLANTNFWLGRFHEVGDNLNEFIRYYRFDNNIVNDQGHDPYIFYLMFSCLTSFQLGGLGESRKTLMRLLAYSQNLDHPFSRVIALQVGTWLEYLFGNLLASRRYAEELVRAASQYGFAFYEGVGMIFEGYALAMDRDPVAGVQRIEAGYRGRVVRDDERAFNSLVALMLGNIALNQGDLSKAEQLVMEAIDISEETGEKCYLSDLLCLRGELRYAKNDKKAATVWFHQAIDIAKKQGAAFGELKATNHLAMLLMERGPSAKIWQLLTPISYRFEDASDCAEVRLSRELLETMDKSQ